MHSICGIIPATVYARLCDLPLSGKSRDDAQHVMLSAAKHLLQILRLAQNDDCFIADAGITHFLPQRP